MLRYGSSQLASSVFILITFFVRFSHSPTSRLVSAIGDTYGAALLLHMLTSTIKLTLLAYQATKIDGLNVYGLTVIGYLVYALAQVFLFCIFGNRLIEEVGLCIALLCFIETLSFRGDRAILAHVEFGPN